MHFYIYSSQGYYDKLEWFQGLRFSICTACERITFHEQSARVKLQIRLDMWQFKEVKLTAADNDLVEWFKQ